MLSSPSKKNPRQFRLRYQIALFDGEADIGVFEPILGDSRCTKGDLLRVDARVKDSHPQKMARFGLEKCLQNVHTRKHVHPYVIFG